MRTFNRVAFVWRVMSGFLGLCSEPANVFFMETHPGGGQYDCLSVFRYRALNDTLCHSPEGNRSVDAIENEH